VLELESELLQQQQEERQNRQRQPAREVGDEEHELPGGKVTEGGGAGPDPPSERRRAPSEQSRHSVERLIGLETLGTNQRCHGDCGGGKQKSASTEKRRGLGDERAQRLKRMQKCDCWPRDESLFRGCSPARAPRNPVRRAPSARCGPVPDTRAWVRKSYTWSTGLRVRRRRTVARGTIRRTIARHFGATTGRYFF
jgi:hypothetical protein